MGTRTASPRGRYGNALSVTRVWRYICKNTTCWPATTHDVTTGVPQYKCRRENTSSDFSSSLTGLFEAYILVRVQFSLYHGEFSALELLIGSWVPLILRNEFSALQSSPSVELALLPSTRGSSMSLPLPSERLSFSAPQSSVIGRSPCWSSQHCSPQPEGHLWACRSLLSVWVPSHSEEWVVLRSRA